MHVVRLNEPECVLPPVPSISDEFGKRLRTSRLPSYGVAASYVSLISSALATLLPSIFTGLPALAPQYRHGALNQALPQVMNGALAWVYQLSTRHLFQLLGHWTSVH